VQWKEIICINYITIKGFYISQAAIQWAAPTAEQVGMVAFHWNKGWIRDLPKKTWNYGLILTILHNPLA
jgi:hypothetical protein